MLDLNPSMLAESTPLTQSIDPVHLTAGWLNHRSIVNLRGDPDDLSFCNAVQRALDLALPVEPCSTSLSTNLQIIWAGPDDWFLISSEHSAHELCIRLETELTGFHKAISDVTGGYRVLELKGNGCLELLAQGCPLDLHPRTFKVGQSAGTVFFKASVWLWQKNEHPTIEMLVRRSFSEYVSNIILRCTK